MQERNDLGRPADAQRDDLDRAGEHAREAGNHVKEAGRHAAEAVEAGASGTLERTADVASGAAGAVTGAAKEAGRTVGTAASIAASGAAGAVAGAGHAVADTARRGAEGAAHAASAAFSAVTSPVRSMASRIADTVGGWWGSAKDAVPEVPPAEQEAVLVLLETMPSAEVVEEVALAAYTLGYMAAQNPDYRGRRFDEVETDVRHAYTGDEAGYGTWRDFTARGYERGTSGL